ncbi:MAG: hypothetical protein JO276_17005 [Sphingomonadaceae bacterium]|nr:hypothetical protein [Sphingomonadaceae bacterium]
MPILPLVALAAAQAAPAPPAVPAPPPEGMCSYLTGDRAHPTFSDDANLHVLAQTAADGQFAPTPPAGAFAITCARASIVPAAHDEEVILAHMPFIITQTGPAPHRAAALGFSGGHFTYTMRSGTLSSAEQAAVDARLAEFLARVHPSGAPAH